LHDIAAEEDVIRGVAQRLRMSFALPRSAWTTRSAAPRTAACSRGFNEGDRSNRQALSIHLRCPLPKMTLHADTLAPARYALHDAIASGGMATVHLGRFFGPAGFARTIAIKRLHPHLLGAPGFASMLAEEARLAARIRHPNVVATLDVSSSESELLLVMDYVDGASLSRLFTLSRRRVPRVVAIAIVGEMLHGLHAAHEAVSETGEPLEIVHRDVSPQNVLVGADGVARLVDFGVARATSRFSGMGDSLKGKLAYMAPEQIRCAGVTRRTDVFAAGIVLWELLTGKKLFVRDNEAATIHEILEGVVPRPSSIASDIPPALDDLVMRALESDPARRFQTAREMAIALEDAHPRALGREVSEWVERVATGDLSSRRAAVARMERTSERNVPTALSRDVFVAEDRTSVDDPWVMMAAQPPPSPYRAGLRTRGVLEAIGIACGLAIGVGVIFAGTSLQGRAAARPVDAATAASTETPSTTTVTNGVASGSTTPATATASAPSAAASTVEILPPTHVTRPVSKQATAPVRRAPTAAPRASGARSGQCVARVDPTTKKTVYEGTCE